MRYLIVLCCLIALAGCGNRSKPAAVAPPPAAAKAPPASVKVDPAVEKAIRSETDAVILPLHRMQDEVEKETVGVQFDVPEDRMEKIRESLSAKLKPQGYMAFLAQQSLGEDGQPARIALMKTADQYAILRAKETNGANYDIDTAAIITKLKGWDAKYGLEIIGADYDWVAMRFKALPPDLSGFAKEVYKFCPDIVDQGTQTVDALADEMKKDNKLMLWWD